MARILGSLPESRGRSILRSLAAGVNPLMRQQLEFQEGEGLRRVLAVVKNLPDSVTVIVQPTLGFLKVDCCLMGHGRLLVVQSAHWKGKILLGKEEQWLGAGKVDIGRPDRRAFVFADRLKWSGWAEGWDIEPVVLFTAGDVDLQAPEPLTMLIDWDEADSFLRGVFLPHLTGPDPGPVIERIGGGR
jgi:hypothetical protein